MFKVTQKECSKICGFYILKDFFVNVEYSRLQFTSSEKSKNYYVRKHTKSAKF